MQTDHGETKNEFVHEIGIVDRIDPYARKAERARQKFLIESNGRSGERVRPKRKNIGPI